MLHDEFKRGEHGFTLVELLVAIMVSGLLLSAITTGFITAMRGTAGAQNRFVASAGAQTLATYFTSDAQSAEPGAVDTAFESGHLSGCSDSSPGTNVVRLQWRAVRQEEVLANSTLTAFSANYRIQQVGSEWQLVRYFCTGNGPLGSDFDTILRAGPRTTHVVVHDLSDPTELASFAGSTTVGTRTVTSATAKFTKADIDQSITGAGIPSDTRIADVVSATQATMTADPTAPATGVTISRYKPIATLLGQRITLKTYADLGSAESMPYFYSLSADMRTPTKESFLVSATSPQTAGQPFSVTVTARKNGATDTGYTGTVHFTSSDLQKTVPADYPFVASDNGTHTFTNGVTLRTAPSQTVTVTDSAQASRIGTTTIIVAPGALSSFSVAAPVSTNAGVPFSVTVTAKDGFGNTVTGYRGTIHFISSDAQRTVPGDYPFVAADNGVHTFTNGVTLRTGGSQTVTVTGNSQTGFATITVNQQSVDHFSVVSQASTNAGAPFSLTVTANDALGNTIVGYTGTVHFTSSDPQKTVPGDYPFVAADNGAHTFTNGVTLRTAPSQTVTATDTATSATGFTTLTVSPAALSTFTVATPVSTTAGVPFSVTVTAKDGFGNTVTGYRGTIHFTSSDAQKTVPVDYPFVAADNGAHTFTNGITLRTAPSQTVTVTGNSQTGFATIPVNAAGPFALAFTNCVVNGTAASCSSPLGNPGSMDGYVSLVDAYGNLATVGSGSTWTVTITRTSGSANFTVTNSTVTITGTGNRSSTPFHVDYASSNQAPATATLTAHATSGSSSVADAAMTARK